MLPRPELGCIREQLVIVDVLAPAGDQGSPEKSATKLVSVFGCGQVSGEPGQQFFGPQSREAYSNEGLVSRGIQNSPCSLEADS